MIKTLLLAALISGPQSPAWDGLIGGTHPQGSILHLNDDILLQFGNTYAAPDCWFEWDTTGTDGWQFSCTDVDGAGTDGSIFRVSTGTDDPVFTGTITSSGIISTGVIYDSADQLDLGNSACTDGHSQGTGDTCASGSLQVDGVAWFDSTLTVAGNLEIGNNYTYLSNSGDRIDIYSNQGTLFRLGADQATAGKYMLGLSQSGAAFEMTASSGTQYNFYNTMEVAQSGTANFIADYIAITDGGTNNGQDYLAQWNWGGVEQFHVQDDGEMSNSGGNQKGALTNYKTKTESVTFAADPGDATKTTTGSILPDGAFVVGVSGRVTTANTGGCTSIKIGDGVDDDLYGASIAVSAGTTFDSTDATANWSNPVLTDTEITVTAVGGDGKCDDMVVALTVHYIDVTAATSN